MQLQAGGICPRTRCLHPRLLEVGTGERPRYRASNINDIADPIIYKKHYSLRGSISLRRARKGRKRPHAPRFTIRKQKGVMKRTAVRRTTSTVTPRTCDLGPGPRGHGRASSLMSVLSCRWNDSAVVARVLAALSFVLFGASMGGRLRWTWHTTRVSAARCRLDRAHMCGARGGGRGMRLVAIVSCVARLRPSAPPKK